MSGGAPPLAEGVAELAARSCEVIRSHQDDGGAYPASPTFSAYRGYAWLRDGSFIAEAMSRYGDVASASRFHDWAAGILVDRAEQVRAVARAVAAREPVPTDLLLPTRYTLEGRDGTDPWWDFQTDGYGMWLWAVFAHVARHDLDAGRWAAPAAVAVDYVCALWDRPCYDWWEEHSEHRHVSTLAALYAGLLASASSGVLDADRTRIARATADQIRELVLAEGVTAGRASDPTRVHLSKWLGSGEVDASLAACIVPFGLIEPGSPLADATLDAIGRDLDVDGGVHRFRADVFYGGGQWLLLSCLVGWNRAALGDRPGAVRHLRWVVERAGPTGSLPEQVADHLLHPRRRVEWVDRWGPVADPLLWSHAMFIVLADELGMLPREANAMRTVPPRAATPIPDRDRAGRRCSSSPAEREDDHG